MLRRIRSLIVGCVLATLAAPSAFADGAACLCDTPVVGAPGQNIVSLCTFSCDDCNGSPACVPGVIGLCPVTTIVAPAGGIGGVVIPAPLFTGFSVACTAGNQVIANGQLAIAIPAGVAPGTSVTLNVTTSFGIPCLPVGNMTTCPVVVNVAPGPAAQTTVTADDSSAPWLGFMNVFELDGTTFVFGSPWGLPDLVSTFDDGAGNVTMSPNTINDPDPFWYIGGGGPGAPGNKIMEANLYFEETDTLGGQMVTFEGTVASNTFTAAHEAMIFIRDFAPDFSNSNDAFIPATPGPFSFSLNTDPAPGRHVQWGFQVKGVNVWAGDEGPFGSVVFGTDAPAMTFAESCNGDGGDQMGCTDCPCVNNAPQGTIGGCLNSAGTSTRLIPSGSDSIAAADLRIEASGAPANNSAVLTSGNALAPANMANPCFGMNSGVTSFALDGLRCAVQGVLRHGVRPSDANGDIGVTTNGWGTPNGFFNFAAFMSGDTKHFQIIHRDDASAVCMTGQNTSQAVSVSFSP